MSAGPVLQRGLDTGYPCGDQTGKRAALAVVSPVPRGFGEEHCTTRQGTRRGNGTEGSPELCAHLAAPAGLWAALAAEGYAENI